MGFEALDRLDADDAFMLGLVRQHRRTRDVADRIDARDVGLAVAIDRDRAAALGLHAELFQAQVLDVADNADRRDDAVDGHLLRAFGVLDRRGNAVGVAVELYDLGAGEDLDALLLECLAREGRDLGVLDRLPAGISQIDANSTPIAPEPITSSDFGILSGTIASK